MGLAKIKTTRFMVGVIILLALFVGIFLSAAPIVIVKRTDLVSVLRLEMNQRLEERMTNWPTPFFVAGSETWWTSHNTPAGWWDGVGGSSNGIRVKSWIYGAVGLESLATYRAYGDTITGLPVLVSPQHFVTTSHTAPQNTGTTNINGTNYVISGEMYVWNTTSGIRHTNHVRAFWNSGNDFAICLLSNPAPATVPVIPWAHVSLTNQLTNAPWIFAGRHGCSGGFRFAIPVINTRTEISGEGNVGANYLVSHYHYQGGNENILWNDKWWKGSVYGQPFTNVATNNGCYRTGPVDSAQGGDSGSPGFLLIENRLVHLGNATFNSQPYVTQTLLKRVMDSLSSSFGFTNQPLQTFRWENGKAVWETMP
jgi:hypothetical protein